MSLKKAILATVEQRRLETIARKLYVCTDETKLASKVARSSTIEARQLLEHLSDRELQKTAAAYRVRPDDDRSQMVARLLEIEAYRESGSEPCLYHRGPFVALALDRVGDNGRAQLAFSAVRGRNAGEATLIDFDGRVRGNPEFGEALAALRVATAEAEFFAAHDADQTMLLLEALCRRARLDPPPMVYQCTYRLVERVWGKEGPPACLDIVAQHPSLLERVRSAAHTVIQARDTMQKRHNGK